MLSENQVEPQVILIDRGESRRYQWQKSSMDRKGIELLSTRQRVQKNSSMDRAIDQEVSRKTQKTSIKEACVKRCQDAIEHTKSRFFKEEKSHKMNATKIDIKPTNKEA